MNNIFIYDDNILDNDLNKLFRNLIYLHSTIGKNINVHLLNSKNLEQYIKIPDNFNLFDDNIKKKYIKYNVIYNWGGIWFSNNILIIKRYDYLFNYLKNNDGFLIKNKNNIEEDLFGFNSFSPFIYYVLNNLNLNINDISKHLFDNIFFYNIDNYKNPILFSNIYEEYSLIYNNDDLMFLIIDMNDNNFTEFNIKYFFTNKYVLNYFINKSIYNLNYLDDLDFIEIGTSYFDTLIETSKNNEKGISIDAVKYYLDVLPEKINVKKINIGISDKKGFAEIYYIPAKIIELLKLPEWYYGCNSLNCYHPYHINNNLEKYVTIEKINIIPTYELFYINKIKKVKVLKIDTEGHDVNILQSLYDYIKYLPKSFYPDKIIFEVEGDANKKNLEKTDNIIKLYQEIGYKLIKKEWDATMILI